MSAHRRLRQPAVERRPAPPSRGPAARISAQRDAGAAISRVARTPTTIAASVATSIQAARVSHPNDPAEREAVHVARNVVQMETPRPPRPIKHDEEEGKRKIQRAASEPQAAAIKPDDEQNKHVVHRAAAHANVAATIESG